MSEVGLNPLESILRLCAAAAPEPWYPRLYAKQSDVDARELGECLEELWLEGLIQRVGGGPETGPGVVLTRAGERVLLEPEALARLRAGRPVNPGDRGAMARRALRGRLRPFVTIALVLANVLVFAHGYSVARKEGVDADFLRGTAATVAKPTPDEAREIIKKQQLLTEILEASGSLSARNLIEGQWRRLLTAGFVHIGFMHLLMNMACLYLAGRFIEQMWGHVRYAVIYLAGILGGSCLAVVHHVDLSAGASGAICGLLAAEAVWFLFNRRYLPRALMRRAWTGVIINLVLLVFISSFPGVSGWGHFGGAAAGALTAVLLHLHRFGPAGWRWLALVGFVPLVWYGDYVIEQARANDPKWHAVEDELMLRHYYAVQKAMRKAQAVYRGEEVQRLLEMHPTRRDPAKVEAVLPQLAGQQQELNALADQLDRAGPYGSPEAEEARQMGVKYLRAGAELFERAEHLLRLGDKRTDEDTKALKQQLQEVEALRKEWQGLFESSR